MNTTKPSIEAGFKYPNIQYPSWLKISKILGLHFTHHSSAVDVLVLYCVQDGWERAEMGQRLGLKGKVISTMDTMDFLEVFRVVSIVVKQEDLLLSKVWQDFSVPSPDRIIEP